MIQICNKIKIYCVNILHFIIRLFENSIYPLKRLSNKRWKRNRVDKIKEALKLSFRDEPFIENGTYHWRNVDTPIFIDILYPDAPFAVIIAEAAYFKKNAKNKKHWEEYRKEIERVCYICNTIGYHVKLPNILITPDDPIDNYTLANRIGPLIESLEE